MNAQPTTGFDPQSVAQLDEPVRRYFAHALAPGASLAPHVKIEMSGRIKVGIWMNFEAEWEGDGESFSWSASAGPRWLRPLKVRDQFAAGSGVMDVRLRPNLKLIHAADDDVARSGAGRAALEAVWTPASLLPSAGVVWRTESDTVIVAERHVAPESTVLRITIDELGSAIAFEGPRWMSEKGEYRRFGGIASAERSFNGITVPSKVSVGWDPELGVAPFFSCEIRALY